MTFKGPYQQKQFYYSSSRTPHISDTIFFLNPYHEEKKKGNKLSSVPLTSKLPLMMLSLWTKTCGLRTLFNTKAWCKLYKNQEKVYISNVAVKELPPEASATALPLHVLLGGAQQQRVALQRETCHMPWLTCSQISICPTAYSKEQQTHNQNNTGKSMPYAHHLCNSPGPQKRRGMQ